MRNWFKKKNNDSGIIYATQTGIIVPLSEVPDDVFREKILGDGIAIIPNNNKVLSPVSGTVINVVDTMHAFCLKTSDNLEIIVHIGIDTVALEGKGFKSNIKEGDKVKVGDELCTVELEYLKTMGNPLHTFTLILNPDMVKNMIPSTGETVAGETIVLRYDI